MAINISAYRQILAELAPKHATLVAVSKIRTPNEILALYKLGQRDFGENYVQELADKAGQLPKDIRWHFIGHLQRNKVKQIAGLVQLIHGADSLKILEEIDKQGKKCGKMLECLLQVHIASEDTKFGFSKEILLKELPPGKMVFENCRIRGLMGMASFTEDEKKVKSEFRELRNLFDELSLMYNSPHFNILSMGMSGDYKLALEEGSNMVRIGSLLFGSRGI